MDVAWVSVAGAGLGALIAISGQVAAARIARTAAGAAVEGDRNQRLWDKRSAAYEDAVKEILENQAQRTALTSRGDVGNIRNNPRDQLLKAEEPDVIRVRALLRAYASEAVWDACQRSDQANTNFWVSLGQLYSAHLSGSLRQQEAAEACAWSRW
jgi:hypothetical protein